MNSLASENVYNKLDDVEEVKIIENEEEHEIRIKGAYLTWSDLCVWAPNKSFGFYCLNKNKRGYKQILNSVNGSATPGSLLAIMGSSGSGKTTTLNFLSGLMNSNLKYSGVIQLNGKKVDIKKYSAFIQQENIFYSNVTVMEHLKMHADLRMGRRFTRKEKDDRIAYLLKSFGLEKVKRATICHAGPNSRGISGGEKKRLSIITELFTDPPILFLDEPTSGLDSYMSKSVISLIREIANCGKTIVCTIHQPSTDTILLFNSIILMYRGHVAITGSINDALEYYKKKGFPCPVNCNPADHLINMVSIDINNEDESHDKIMSMINIESEPVVFTENELPNTAEELISVQARTWFGSYKANELVQFKYLFLRGIISLARQPYILTARIIMELFLGLIIGLLYFRPPYDTNNLQNFVGLIFFECAGLTINGILASTLSIPDELRIFLNEHRSNLYRTTVYFIAKTLSDLPYQILQNFCTVILVYLLIGLRNGITYFLLHLIIIILMYQASLSYGYLASSLSNTSLTALAVASPLLIPLLVFGSFLITESQIPTFLRWVRYISWFPYANDALLDINFNGVNLECVRGLFCPFPALTPTVSAQQLLSVLGIKFNNVGYNVLGLFFLIFMYRGLAVIVIIARAVLQDKGIVL